MSNITTFIMGQLDIIFPMMFGGYVLFKYLRKAREARKADVSDNVIECDDVRPVDDVGTNIDGSIKFGLVDMHGNPSPF